VPEHVAEDVELAADDLELGRIRAELDAVRDAVRAKPPNCGSYFSGAAMN
jgi:hypothetical protein